MNLISPEPTPYDPLEWERLPHAEKVRLACQAWCVQGYGTPLAIYLVYALKVALYVGAWAFFCSFTPGLGDPRSVASWWAEPVAFQKAILWSMLFEGLGLGCGSGPLTGRYAPPVGGFLYFLRPGTTKLPLVPGLPIVGGHRRTWLDVALYLAHAVFLVRVLVAPEITPALLLPTVILLPALGLCDKTLFLAARAEHYGMTALCFLFPGWLAGSQIVQAALWFWAGVSKLNHHFPAVVAIMTSNSPILRFGRIRRRMYRAYPDDVRPSTLAVAMAHAGTSLELGVPIILLASGGGTATVVGLVLMVALHGFITSNVPMGVPIEWNVMVVYGAFFLFGANAGVDLSAIDPLLAAALVVGVIAVPAVGNVAPRLVSFLLAMRYYAGNWAYSIWLFRGEAHRRLDERLVKSSAWPIDQLARFYDRGTAVGLVGKVVAFRAMHLQGRAIQLLLPKAVDRVEDYEYLDGELVAGVVLGWNFGEGHLHDEQLLAAVQAQCDFDEGELRCILIESQPIHRQAQRWRIHDARTGLIDEGEVRIDELRALQPWAVGEGDPPPGDPVVDRVSDSC